MDNNRYFVLSAGLIDSTSDDFEVDYQVLESKWIGHSPEGEAFSEYFRKYKLSETKRTMLLSHRVAGGLGLDVYTQNASECMNQLIKRGIDTENMSVYQITEYLRSLENPTEKQRTCLC